MKGRAFFVKYPSRIDDLLRPHAFNDQKPYTIVATMTLVRIDYENFITDFTVERWFLKKNVPLCRTQKDSNLFCVFVRQHGQKDGVLVVPDELGMVAWAAYLPKVNPKRVAGMSQETAKRMRASIGLGTERICIRSKKDEFSPSTDVKQPEQLDI